MKNKIIFLCLIYFLLFLFSSAYSQEEEVEKIKTIDEIIEELKGAINLAPGDTALYFLLGEAYDEKNLLESAYSEYEKILNMNPENVTALLRMGIISLRRENFEEAEEKLTKALELESGSSELFYAEGLAHEFSLRYELAIEDYNNAVDKYDNLIKIYEYLGVISGHRGTPEKGIEYFQNSLNIKESLAKVYAHLGFVYRKTGDIEFSIILYKKAVEMKPDDEKLYLNLALSFSLVDSLHEDAVNFFGKSIEIDSTNAEVHYKLGMVYGRMGKLGHQIWELQKAVKIDSTNAPALMDLAIAYFNNKMYSASWEQIKEAEKLGYKVSEDFIEILTKAIPRPKN